MLSKSEFDTTTKAVLSDYDQRKEIRSLLKGVAFEPILLSRSIFGETSTCVTFLAIFTQLHEDMGNE